MRLGVILALAASPMMFQVAMADVFVDAGPNGNLAEWLGGDYVAGSEFTVSGGSITINALGWIDAEGDGLVDSHRVGLWDVATEELVVESTVTPDSVIEASANGVAQWFMEGIGFDLELGPGVYRVAGIVGTVGDNFAISDDQIGNGVTVSSNYYRTEFPDGGFNFPEITFSTTPIRATVGFISNPVPEPSVFAILLATGILACGRRQRG